MQLLYYLHEYVELNEKDMRKLQDGRKCAPIGYLHFYLKNHCDLQWLGSVTSLGKKLHQWYGLESKRLNTKVTPYRDEKVTFYIFDKQSIEDLMKEYDVTLSDFE